MDHVRVGVIGCGGMAQNHMRGFADVKHATFTAAADPDERSRKTVADTYKVKTYADGQEMLDAGVVDAVLIATPHYFHPTYTIAALERGIHVLTEKPLAVTASAAQAMIDAADARPDLVFAAMFQMRINPLWREAKRLIDAGEVGELLRTSWVVTTWFRTQAYYDSGGWRATWKGEGGGVLINQCPHNLDLFQWLVGMPSQVTAQVGLGKHHHIEVEDEVNALLRFPNGATGVFVTSTAELPGINRLEIVGDRGTLIVSPGATPSLELLRNSVSAREYLQHSTERMKVPAVSRYAIEPGGEHPGHYAIFANFIDAIVNGDPLIAPGREGIHGLELGNAMLMSGLTNQPVDLPTDRAAYDALIQDLIKNSTFKKRPAPEPAAAQV